MNPTLTDQPSESHTAMPRLSYDFVDFASRFTPAGARGALDYSAPYSEYLNQKTQIDARIAAECRRLPNN
jgi:hypothetical protein